MKTISLIISLAHTGPVAASFFHWGHHDEAVLRHYKFGGPFEKDMGPPYGYVSLCEAEASFKAAEYTTEDLHTPPPQGLSPWAPAIDAFLKGREYPGHWKGLDDHGDENSHRREYLVMEYADVPRPVRQWIEDHQRKGTDSHKNWMFAVLDKPKGDEKVSTTRAAMGSTPDGGDKDKILFFAAGSIYEILPLWVAEGSKCQGKNSIKSSSVATSCQ
jgi:hypothetical protein